MDIRRNDTSALTAFTDLNMAWIKNLHIVEASDQHMADHPEIYMQEDSSVFSAHLQGKSQYKEIKHDT